MARLCWWLPAGRDHRGYRSGPHGVLRYATLKRGPAVGPHEARPHIANSRARASGPVDLRGQPPRRSLHSHFAAVRGLMGLAPLERLRLWRLSNLIWARQPGATPRTPADIPASRVPLAWSNRRALLAMPGPVIRSVILRKEGGLRQSAAQRPARPRNATTVPVLEGLQMAPPLALTSAVPASPAATRSIVSMSITVSRFCAVPEV